MRTGTISVWAALTCCTAALSCTAQEAYTIGHYLRDRMIDERVDSAQNAENKPLALHLHRTKADRSPGGLFWRAQLAWSAGEDHMEYLREAFDKGYRYIPNNGPDDFQVANAELLHAFETDAARKRDMHRIARCMALIARDQELASSSYVESLARAMVDTLDLLIREGGWPSSYLLDGPGVEIVLAHQHWDKAHLFEPYQALIEEECKAGREDWNAALLTLQQRIRWTARNKTDTITFTNLALSDHDPALPMVVAISHRMLANGHKQLWVHAQDSITASTIAERIIEVQPVDRTPPEILEYLKANNFDHPAPVAMERITLVIDAELPGNTFLYRMN